MINKTTLLFFFTNATLLMNELYTRKAGFLYYFGLYKSRQSRPSTQDRSATPYGAPPPLVTISAGLYSSTTTPMEQAMAKSLSEMESMIQWIPGVPTPLKKSQLDNYANSLFVDSIVLVAMIPRIILHPTSNACSPPSYPMSTWNLACVKVLGPT